MTKFDRKIFIEEMSSNNILFYRDHRGSKLYSIKEEYQSSILSLINQNNLEPKLESFCDYLMAKYYKS
jgi:hypothetical protein